MPVSVDVDALRVSLTDWANRGAGEALDDLRQQTHDRAPFGVSEGDNPGPHLIDSEEAVVLNEGEVWQGTLAYTVDHASYLDDGTGPHQITGNPLLAFPWHGMQVIVRSVQHPGSQIHKGWFSDVITDENWADTLTRSLDTVEAT